MLSIAFWILLVAPNQEALLGLGPCESIGKYITCGFEIFQKRGTCQDDGPSATLKDSVLGATSTHRRDRRKEV